MAAYIPFLDFISSIISFTTVAWEMNSLLPFPLSFLSSSIFPSSPLFPLPLSFPLFYLFIFAFKKFILAKSRE
jgi:hypothetical protein